MDRRDRFSQLKNEIPVSEPYSLPASGEETSAAVAISHLLDSDTDDLSEVENPGKNRSIPILAPHKKVKNMFKSVFKFKKHKKTDANSSDGYQSDTQSVASESSMSVRGNDRNSSATSSSVPIPTFNTPMLPPKLSVTEVELLCAFVADLNNKVCNKCE
jgi:hypothetical protein